jgi:hypothetical protein
MTFASTSASGIARKIANRAKKMGYIDALPTIAAAAKAEGGYSSLALLLDIRSDAFLDSGAHQEHVCGMTSDECGSMYAVSELIECN